MQRRQVLAAGAVLPALAATRVQADGHEDPALRLVQDYIETVVNNREFNRIDEFVAEDIIQHNPNLPNGREPLRQFWESFLEAMPEARINVVRSVSDGEFVWEHALLTRSAEDPGIAAVDIYRVENALIVQHWDVVQEVPAETASGNHMVLRG